MIRSSSALVRRMAEFTVSSELRFSDSKDDGVLLVLRASISSALEIKKLGFIEVVNADGEII